MADSRQNLVKKNIGYFELNVYKVSRLGERNSRAFMKIILKKDIKRCDNSKW